MSNVRSWKKSRISPKKIENKGANKDKAEINETETTIKSRK